MRNFFGFYGFAKLDLYEMAFNRRDNIYRGAAKGGSTRSMDPPVLIVVGPGRSSSDFLGSDSYFLGSDSYFLG